MLPKLARLTKDQDLYKVRRYGRQSSNAYINIRALTTKSPKTRLGFIVSKKISPQATTRNRLKRQLRAVISKEYQQIKKNRDIIITAKPNIKKIPFNKITQVIQEAMKRASLLK
ncbi:MAG: ribonuclease P protein component [bacterium]